MSNLNSGRFVVSCAEVAALKELTRELDDFLEGSGGLIDDEMETILFLTQEMKNRSSLVHDLMTDYANQIEETEA